MRARARCRQCAAFLATKKYKERGTSFPFPRSLSSPPSVSSNGEKKGEEKRDEEITHEGERQEGRGAGRKRGTDNEGARRRVVGRPQRSILGPGFRRCGAAARCVRERESEARAEDTSRRAGGSREGNGGGRRDAASPLKKSIILPHAHGIRAAGERGGGKERRVRSLALAPERSF